MIVTLELSGVVRCWVSEFPQTVDRDIPGIPGDHHLSG